MSTHGKVRLQYVLGTGFTSRVIEWYGRAFSHVDSVLPDGYGYPTGSLIGSRSDWVRPIGRPADEAQIAPGVQVRPAGYEKWARRTVFEIPCTREQEQAYYTGVLAELGKPYDKIGIIEFALSPQPRDFREPTMWFCDELAVAKLEAAKIVHKLFMSARSITPGGSTLVVTAVGGHVVEDENG